MNEVNEADFEEDERGEMHLVMEMMETSLSSILKKVRRPLPYHLAIDIMDQIAKGGCFLHDMQVAHLDLKPDNVLSSSVSIEGLDSYSIFKVMDYGTCQVEVCSHPKNPEPWKCTLGTRGYMSPEVIRDNKTPLYPFQADVWSFAMICSEILSGKVPYPNLKVKEFKDLMSSLGSKGLRPKLPNNCKVLTNLIEECWVQDPLQRPSFSEICARLIGLKKSFWKGEYPWKMVPQFGSSHGSQDSKSIVDLVPKIEETIGPHMESVIDLEHQLFKAKEILGMDYIGIVGMGGIGKTTLATAIFDDVVVKSSYEESCFVADCKDSQSSYNTLCKILLELRIGRIPKDLEDAQEMMQELLLAKKVLLILDDVDNESQVLNIVPVNIVQASKGSTIIITTRDLSTIKSFVSNEGRLDVELLNDEASTMLFTTHLSWDEASLSLDFVNFRNHVVKACNGLPLSLKVMASFLCTKRRLQSWERALQKMARGRNLDGSEGVFNTLRISYDEGLNGDDVAQGLFLDVACFFCKDVYPFGVSKETMLTMWSRNGILPVQALQRLVDMSLMKVNKDDGILEMHDQVRDMGRMIAKGSRVWKASMISESGFTPKDGEVVEGILLQNTMNIQLCFFKQDRNVHFEKLRVLVLVGSGEWSFSNDNFLNLFFLLFIASQCLNLEAIMIKASNKTLTLPVYTIDILRKAMSDLCATQTSLKILDLTMLGFLRQLPHNLGSSKSLLRLDLCYCDALEALPREVGTSPSLTTLILKRCSSLVALPKEVGNLSALTTLNLRLCSSLVALPKEVGNLSSLTALNLSGCSSLAAFPREVGNLSSLIVLNLSGCLSLVALPKEVGNLSSLTTLNLSGCSSFVALPKEVGNLSSLIVLNLSWCSSLVALPKEVGNLSLLTTLDLSECSSLVALPKEVGNLSLLTTLVLWRCSSLVALPKEVGNLSLLTTLVLWRCSSLVALPKEVGNLSSLTSLNLSSCSSLAALPKEVGNLSLLTTFNLSRCSSLVALPKEVGNLSSLTTFNLFLCSSLVALPKEVGNLSLLTTLYLSKCSSLVVLPKEVRNLSSLTSLYLRCCSSLVDLPKEIGSLFSLTTLNLYQCSSLVALCKEVGNLSLLTTLDLCKCSSLVALPKELGNLSLLTTLDLRHCSSLAAMPKEVGNLSSLTTLDLGWCLSLVDLPKEVGNLCLLTTLDLSWSSSLVALPKEVGNLSLLTNLNLSTCSSLVALPKEIGNLSLLNTLSLSMCSSLVALPKEVGNFSSLPSLYLIGCSSWVTLPKEVGSLSSLINLNLRGCSSLVALPKEVGNLSSFIALDLSGCSSLVALPKEVGNLSLLTTLDLSKCSSLEALPKEVGNLSLLTTLDLRQCSSLGALPKEVSNFSFLTTLDL